MVNLNDYSQFNRTKNVFLFLCIDFWPILCTQICWRNGNLSISHKIRDPDIHFLRVLKTNYSIVPLYIHIYILYYWSMNIGITWKKGVPTIYILLPILFICGVEILFWLSISRIVHGRQYLSVHWGSPFVIFPWCFLNIWVNSSDNGYFCIRLCFNGVIFG